MCAIQASSTYNMFTQSLLISLFSIPSLCFFIEYDLQGLPNDITMILYYHVSVCLDATISSNFALSLFHVQNI